MKKTKLNFPALTAGLLYSLMAGQPALADDTEVLIGPGGVAWGTPNVLFIMDTSGSMRRDVDGNEPPAAGELSRLAIVQDVFSNLMTDYSGYGLNVGLMRFNSGGNGGYFISPMQPLNSSTRDDIVAASDNLSGSGNTPLSETLYEAARYYRGMSVDFGGDSVSGVLDPDNSNNYLSPITSQCQANYVILLTDGQPNGDNQANASIETMTGSSCSGNCLDELSGYLHNTDQDRNISGDQTIETYTIGFTTNQTLLQNTASNGGGEYMVAENANELRDAFSSFLETIVDTNNSFSPPALAANAFNTISHYNRLYFTLFEPAATPKWQGNVKPYKLAGDPPEITDAGNNVAVDNRGFFLESSRSFWAGSAADGGSIAAGGANGRLPAANSRNLYTYTGSYSTGGVLNGTASLNAASNALDTSVTSDLTPAMLGLTDPDEFARVINTVRSSTLGAPLHSNPALVTYGGTEDNPDVTLFVATNSGFLHALDASDVSIDSNGGVEQFAFIPQELLPNLPTLTRGTGTHPYGLDGDITVWIQESNDDDATIESSDGDHVYVYVGMRRGGNNYYALDVTNRNEPKLKWVIRGGPGGDADFAELGQSWSKPAVTKIYYGGAKRTVLIFGGGYDTDQDNNAIATNDDIGRAVYIVDADTGQRLWWAGPSGSGANLEMASMTNSIPSAIRLMDSNLDGYTDRLYVGDMRGQIFRFDIRDADTLSASGTLLASLGGADAANNRRFYYPPDLVVTRQPGLPTYISINIGSGYRAHPLNPTGPGAVRVNDRFYSLRDFNIIGEVPASFTTITESGSRLFDATNSLVDSEGDIDDLAVSSGWYITLGNGNGEKVLAPAITLNGEIYFTTYTPPANVERTDCAPPPGIGRLYRVSLFNASPVLTTTEDGPGNPSEPTTEDRSKVLDRPGIPPEPTVIFREDGTPTPCVGTECEPLPNAIKMEETYWRDDA